MNNDSMSILRIAKLDKPSDFLRWKRQLKAYIQRDDPLLKGFNPRPEQNNRQQTEWDVLNAKSKSNIILTLGEAFTAKVRVFVDSDDHNTKELWDEIARIHTVSNTQAIANLQQRLDNLVYDEKKKFDDHVSSFLSIIDELSSLDQNITEQDKITKLIRSLPPSFDALSMAISLNETTFDNVVTAVQANIERRSRVNHQAGASSSANPQAFMSYGQPDNPSHHYPQSNYRGRGGRGGRGRGRGRGCGGRSYGDNRTCHYCRKPGHFIKFCRLRLANEGGGSIGKSHRGRGSLSRGGPSRGAFSHHQVQQYHNQENNHQGSFSFNQGNQGQPSHFQANVVQGQATPSFDVPPPPPYYQNNPHARMARFRSKVAKLGEEKTDDLYIDSGATHHFFHRRNSFITYEATTPEAISTANGESCLVGKGTVYLPIGEGIIVEAYHAPQFTSNIIANHLCSLYYNLFYTSDEASSDCTREAGSRKRCEIIKKGSRTDIVQVVPCIDGLYPVRGAGNKQKKANLTKSHPHVEFKEWHEKTGHIGNERFRQLAEQREDVPNFEPAVMKQLECVPCLTAKMKKAPVRATPEVDHDGVIHFDISGPLTPSLGGSVYAAHFLEPKSGKSDVIPIKKKSDLPNLILAHIRLVKNHYAKENYRVKVLRCDRVKENYPAEVVNFNLQNGIKIEFSLAYAPESNGTAERLVQENWTGARVLLHGSTLSFSLWGEALAHANWLRNRVPSSRINDEIPMLRWDKSARINFKKLHTFGQAGYAFIYYPKTQPGRKLLPRSEFAHFVGMESDDRLVRVFVPATNTIRIVRHADFHVLNGNRLPSVSSLLDGLARQKKFQDQAQTLDEEDAEELLAQCMAAIYHHAGIFEYTEYTDRHNYRCNLVPHKSYQGISDGPPLPRSFADACRDPRWAAAIDREYNALVSRGTWEYIPFTPEMQPVPFKWAFRAKQIDQASEKFLYKARCNLRGDQQVAYEDFNPEELYAPVAAHESIRMLVQIAASLGLILEGADITNVYLNGWLDVPIIMQQPTDSSGLEAYPGMVCLLRRSIYGARQAGKIWGTVLHDALLEYGFITSSVESRVYFLQRGSSFSILTIVVDDIMFASNDQSFLESFKSYLARSSTPSSTAHSNPSSAGKYSARRKV